MRDNVFAIVERQILAFPIVVVLLTAVAFLCGGHCAPWQWWTSVVLTLAIGFVGQDRRDALKSGTTFVVGLLLYWLVCNLMATEGPGDMVFYHNPATRLLAAGWNPVYEGTPEAIQAKFGIDSSWYRVWHVLSIPKAVWCFNAVAYKFHGNAFNMMFGIFPFLALAVAFRIARVFASAHWTFKLLACLFVLGITPGCGTIVDAVTCLCAIGLLLAFWHVINDDRWDWLALFAFSFWMCTAKHMCMLHCFFIWCCIAVAVVRSTPRMLKLAIFAVALGCGVLLACVSPYITQTVNFGHPLYPCYSTDVSRHPVINIVGEFQHRNSDAERMGHLGAFVNSYVSETAAHAYYRWKFKRPDFGPAVSWWQQQTGDASSHGPTGWGTKAALWLIFAFVMILGTKTDRILVGVSTLCMMVIPTPMIGYVRYVPWFLWGVVLVARIIAHWESARLRRCVGAGIGLTGAACCFGTLAIIVPWRLNSGYAARHLMLTQPPKKMYCPSYSSALSKDREREATLANVVLLQRQVPALKSAEIVRVPAEPSELLAYENRQQNMGCFTDSSFYVDEKAMLIESSEWLKLGQLSRSERMRAYPLFILKSWFVILPQAVCELLEEKFNS